MGEVTSGEHRREATRDLKEAAHRVVARSVELQSRTRDVLALAAVTLDRARDEGWAKTDRSLIESLRSEVEGLRRAMESRAAIEQAKGIVMARAHVSSQQAFDLLVERS